MLRLLLVKYGQDSSIHAKENNGCLSHGTDILKYSTLPWDNSEQGFCADSYFASVSSAEEMMRLGLKLIGVVNTATETFPINYLPGIETI